MTPTQSTYDALEGAYDALNAAIYDDALPPVIITLKRLRARAGVKYIPADFKAWKGDGRPVGSIALAPETLADAKRAIATLAYAMGMAAVHEGLPVTDWLDRAGVRIATDGTPYLLYGGAAYGVMLALQGQGWSLDYAGVLKGRATQGTYMLKASCPECGYLVRLTRRWADVGLPSCPVHGITLALDTEG